jgi:ADP-ribosylation factor GTPase-activating protein 1
MDAWSPDQLLKMQAGGNGKCNSFLKQYGIDKHTDIKEKYNSQAAEVRRRSPCCIETVTWQRPD